MPSFPIDTSIHWWHPYTARLDYSVITSASWLATVALQWLYQWYLLYLRDVLCVWYCIPNGKCHTKESLWLHYSKHMPVNRCHWVQELYQLYSEYSRDCTLSRFVLSLCPSFSKKKKLFFFSEAVNCSCLSKAEDGSLFLHGGEWSISC